MSEIEDRRQRAYFTFVDKITNGSSLTAAMEEAIEVATRVKLTPEAYTAANDAYDREGQHSFALEAAVRAALEALGFEVES